MDFLSDDILEQSGVVANCRMNRERELTGSNGYAYELGFNPVDLLKAKAASASEVRWLDLCCGTGRALIEAAHVLRSDGLEDCVRIVGVDLVGMFASVPADLDCLQLIMGSLTTWKPDRQYDLITCVHGLHYIGDKLGLISRSVSWLTRDGLFVANLDLNNIKLLDAPLSNRRVTSACRSHGLQYSVRNKRIRCDGRREIVFPFQYLGANDQAGPNYTGQPAVNSCYRTRNPSE